MPKRRRRSPLKSDALPRAALGKEVKRQVRRLGLTQAMTAKLVDDATTQINRLMNDHIEEFSADRLVKFLLRLGSDVTVEIRHSRKLGRRGKASVRVGR